MDEYLLYYKSRLPRHGSWSLNWDIFISAFNSSERVKLIAQHATAAERYWLMLPEYQYSTADYPADAETYAGPADDEAQYISRFLAGIPDLQHKRIAIDIT